MKPSASFPFNRTEALETLRTLARQYWMQKDKASRSKLKAHINLLREHQIEYNQSYSICYDIARPTWDDFTELLFAKEKTEPAKASTASTTVQGKIPSTKTKPKGAQQ